MNEYQEFVSRTVIDFVNLNNVIKKQACQLEVMKTKNQQLETLVEYLKGKIIELNPDMKQEFDVIKI